jgi:hypothetical protein
MAAVSSVAYCPQNLTLRGGICPDRGEGVGFSMTNELGELCSLDCGGFYRGCSSIDVFGGAVVRAGSVTLLETKSVLKIYPLD